MRRVCGGARKCINTESPNGMAPTSDVDSLGTPHRRSHSIMLIPRGSAHERKRGKT